MLLELHPRITRPTDRGQEYKLQRVKTAIRKSEQHLLLAQDELSAFIHSLEFKAPSDFIEMSPEIKHRIKVICNFYSSEYEKVLKEKLAQFQVTDGDNVNLLAKQKLQNQLASVNHTGTKVFLGNDTVNKSLHQFLSGRKRNLKLPPLRNCLGREAKSMQGNVEILVDHYASISQSPETNIASQDEMLKLIPDSAIRVFQDWEDQ